MSICTSLKRPLSFDRLTVVYPVKHKQHPASSKPSIQSATSLPEDAIEVGVVVNAYGLTGQLKIVPHSSVSLSSSAMLCTRSWWLVKSGICYAEQATLRKVHSATVVVRLSGCINRDQALALCGATVYLRRVDFPTLLRNEYYWVDLIGLVVINESGDVLGQVVGLIDNSAHSIMRVEYNVTRLDQLTTKAERLIPFVGTYVKKVDLADRRIIVDWGVDY
ncbi:ribosome maturation factor RimM [Candidatus Vallotia cooleyia]|uniref:ribosome maturation factor RimM n=1 Tax=Candidatus Vallotiella adelgis TaxID=1177211 RepID=UPI001D0247F6|nr:ribosome maturation factor RimM [Candidatus Vallotia cooleyia]UDG82064.1 Ribosome maturation factor RimM [Candidatus Vallotia cooleyia]